MPKWNGEDMSSMGTSHILNCCILLQHKVEMLRKLNQDYGVAAFVRRQEEVQSVIDDFVTELESRDAS